MYFQFFLCSSPDAEFLAQTAKLVEAKDFAGLVEKVFEKIPLILLQTDSGEMLKSFSAC